MIGNGTTPQEPVRDDESSSEPAQRTWSDDNPFWMLIVRPDSSYVVIDLGESGWMTTYAEWLRGRSQWSLVRKDINRPLFTVDVFDGEQPYYTARHIGAVGSGGGNEITAYGIGKKRLDGHVDRLWVLPDGTVCGGDDVDTLGLAAVHALGPR